MRDFNVLMITHRRLQTVFQHSGGGEPVILLVCVRACACVCLCVSVRVRASAVCFHARSSSLLAGQA